ncbi:uncharacterized protein LOC144088190 isoform X2 [Stigmatopora argus]
MACKAFQANIFNKSKCQNCFKSREVHVPTHPRMENAKALYAGWLCLAPEGTDFEKTPARSRKWQRRFFVLYEHGVVTFALDDLPCTLPQGTLDMNACTTILDAEARTGQKNTLCIITTLREVYLRADSKDTINGWGDQLVVFVKANAGNLKKKRKVDAASMQVPSPANMAAPTSQGKVGGEELRLREIRVSPAVTCVSDRDARDIGDARKPFDPCREPNEQESCSAKTHAHGTDAQPAGRDATDRHVRTYGDGGDSEPAEREVKAAGWKDRINSVAGGRTLERPDLSECKKGWLVKLDEDTQWRKYWFVLFADRLTFYKDILAEEASEQEGQVDLSESFKVSEQQVHKNYGLQIHTPRGVCTLSAMTAGIRRNWIQALLKNRRAAPDVSGLSGLAGGGGDPKPDSLPKECTTRDRLPKPRSVLERKREGRYKTFDWADFRPPAVSAETSDVARSATPPSLSPAPCGDLEKKRRREARRRRFESILGLPPGREVMGDAAAAATLKHQMEACWKQVERKNSPRSSRMHRIDDKAESAHDCAEALEELKRQLELSERSRRELEARLRVWTSCDAAATTSRDELHAPGYTIPEWPRCDETDDLLTVRRQSAASPPSDDDWDFRTVGPPPNGSRDREEFAGDCRELPGTDAPPRPDSEGDRELVREARTPGGREKGRPGEADREKGSPCEADRQIPRPEELPGLAERLEVPEEELPGLAEKLEVPEEELPGLAERLEVPEEELPGLAERLEVPEVEHGPGEDERSLLRCFRATEAKVAEMEGKLRALELSCERLQAENGAPKEQNAPCGRALGSAAADQSTRRLLEWSELKWKVLDRFLEVVDRLDTGKTKTGDQEEAPDQLKPEELWSVLLDGAVASRLPERDGALPDTVSENRMTTFGGDTLPEDGSPSGLEGKCVPGLLGRVLGTRDDPESGGKLEFLGTMAQIIASWINTTSSGAREKAGMTADRLRATFIFSTEAAFCCHVTSKCDRLLEENARLRRRLSRQEGRVASLDEREDAGEASTMTGRVRDLEGRLASDRIRHEREMQKIKAECERGLATMEDCHVTAVEELQRQHQREVESLLAQRDRMLEEEAVATATAMEAIQHAHRVELDGEVQRRCRSLNVTGNALLEEVYKQHSQELAAYQRQLDDLSYGLTIKCVEMTRVAQQLDAQREMLSRWQKENRDLAEQNQELSAQLAAQVEGPSALPADRDAAGLRKMQLLLRVKESQLQSARRQSAALRERLREAQSRLG